MSKRKIKSHKGGRSKWLPGVRITDADLELFNQMRGDTSSADFFRLLLYFYRDNGEQEPRH